MTEERITCFQGQVGAQWVRGQESLRCPGINLSICIFVLRTLQQTLARPHEFILGPLYLQRGEKVRPICWDGPGSKAGSGPRDGWGRVSQNAFLLPRGSRSVPVAPPTWSSTSADSSPALLLGGHSPGCPHSLGQCGCRVPWTWRGCTMNYKTSVPLDFLMNHFLCVSVSYVFQGSYSD